MAKARDGGYATSASEEVSSDSEARWVSWFCGLKGNEFFCEVRRTTLRQRHIHALWRRTSRHSRIGDAAAFLLSPSCSDVVGVLFCLWSWINAHAAVSDRQVDEDFIQDDFNLCSLATQVTYYNYALGTNEEFYPSPRVLQLMLGTGISCDASVLMFLPSTAVSLVRCLRHNS
jgi:Casein kinase II regulatory subunit